MRSSLRRGAATVTTAFIALVVTGGAAAASEPSQLVPPIDVPIVSYESQPATAPGARPASRAESAGLDRVTAPQALVSPVLVSATTAPSGTEVPLLVPRSALPWKFSIDTSLATRFGEEAISTGVRQWDGVAGSRWSTAYAGLVDAGGREQADGRSVVFLKGDCPAGVSGYAYWQTASAVGDARYGDAAVYLTEIDVAVCSSVQSVSALRVTLAHEIGHALGQQHLCNPGEGCWREGMGQGSHHCRVMYKAPGGCGGGVGSLERDAAAHLYPTIERLSGPTRIETAARASFASFARAGAATVVLARADESAHGPLAAAALAGAQGAAFLLGAPDMERCVTGTTAEELARVATDGARVVLVGSWPASCTAVLQGWGLTVARVDGPTPVDLGLAAADTLAGTGRMGDTAFVIAAAADSAGHVPDGVAAGAAAGATRGPVLFTGRDTLADGVRGWLQRHEGVRRAYVLGGGAVLSDTVLADLRALGLDVVRVAGGDRVATATALASVDAVFPRSSTSVVLATSSSWADAVTASATGARLHAPVLVTPSDPHPGVVRWLEERRPRNGYVVGGRGALPYTLQWRYAQLVG